LPSATKNPSKNTNKKNPDIFMISLGCPRNLVDSEVLIGELKKKNFSVFHEFKKDAVCIINTCGFIEDAKSESINFILEVANLKKEGKIKSIIVTGCLSQRYSRYLIEEIQEIDGIFGSSTFLKIPSNIEKITRGEKVIMIDEEPRYLYDHESPRSVITPSHSVYVKIQEGCMNFCSYCVIPKIRGPFRSRSTDSILKEISMLKSKGAREVNIIGQDTTLYGIDKFKKKMTAELLGKISKEMSSGWVRLLYTHPAHYTDELIKVLGREKPICKYVDLPIQHISDSILKKMNRHVTKNDIITLIEKLRKNIPGMAIRTSVIVGFPGESEKDFKELAEFVKDVKFDRLGTFTYSLEEGTKAYSFPKQVPDKEKQSRLKHIMKLQQDVSRENNNKYMGKTVRVLVDQKDPSSPGQYIARTEHDAPEVDGVVYVRSKKELKPGDFIDVSIEDTLEYDLVGVHEFS